jgi:phosphoribosyl 1,2-cyclic phosphate phosphodiesterase
VSTQKLRITFLGTGTSSGVPMIACTCAVCTSNDANDNRLRSSILVQSANTHLVVDTTPDFRYQMLRAKVTQLDALLYTHAHKDHIAGMDDIRAYNYFTKAAMPVYANQQTQAALKNEFAYAFAEDKYPGVPAIDLHLIGEQPFTVGDIEVTPIKVWHHNMLVLGFRFGNFTYITDANRMDEAEKKKILGSKVLVLNALRKEQHISHFTLDEVVALAQELEMPQTYCTHISHQMGLHKEVNAALPKNISLAHDGLVIEIN